MPDDRLARLRQCEIWIEHKHPQLAAMQYHPSEAWLRGNGHDPRLAKKVLITRAEALLSREQLLDHVWGFDFDPGSNVVDVYVGYLRRKIGATRIATVRGVGFQYVVAERR